MYKRIPPLLLALSLLATISRAAPQDADQAAQSQRAGHSLGQALMRLSGSLDPAGVAAGLRESLQEQKELSQEELETLAKSLETVMSKLREATSREAKANKKLSDEFLAANAKKEGVVALPSGLQYKELKAGTGNSPALTDRVSVHYRGKLVDGTEFDSSYKRGMPATFPLNGVIPGWTEALQLMKPGAKWEVYLPPDLAYGEAGAPPNIPPNSALVFEIEFLSIAQ